VSSLAMYFNFSFWFHQVTISSHPHFVSFPLLGWRIQMIFCYSFFSSPLLSVTPTSRFSLLCKLYTAPQHT
jgi:hypothetical protein